MRRFSSILIAVFTALFLGGIGSIAVVASASADDPCVPQDARTETVHHDAVTEERVVEEARTEVIPGTEDRWDGLQWFVWTGGPMDSAPARDADGWHSPPALPAGLPHAPEPGLIYNVSTDDSGLGSWFKYDGTFVPGTPEQVIEHPAVVETVVVKEASTETIEHEAVVCDDEPPVGIPADDQGVDDGGGNGGGDGRDGGGGNPIEQPGPGETITHQVHDGDGNLIEQRVGTPIPADANQEGM